MKRTATTDGLIPYPWPFPQWNGERWVMPLELAPEDVRRAAKQTKNDLSNVEEAPF